MTAYAFPQRKLPDSKDKPLADRPRFLFCTRSFPKSLNASGIGQPKNIKWPGARASNATM